MKINGLAYSKQEVKYLQTLKSLPDSEKEAYFLSLKEMGPENFGIFNMFIEALPSRIRLKYLDIYKFEFFFPDSLLVNADDYTKFTILKYYYNDHTTIFNFESLIFEPVPKFCIYNLF